MQIFFLVKNFSNQQNRLKKKYFTKKKEVSCSDKGNLFVSIMKYKILKNITQTKINGMNKKTFLVSSSSFLNLCKNIFGLTWKTKKSWSILWYLVLLTLHVISPFPFKKFSPKINTNSAFTCIRMEWWILCYQFMNSIQTQNNTSHQFNEQNKTYK